jgi:translation initiation factor 1
MDALRFSKGDKYRQLSTFFLFSICRFPFLSSLLFFVTFASLMAKQKKIKRDTDGIVYSTEPDYAFKDLLAGLFQTEENEASTNPEAGHKGKLVIRMEKKGRGGKTVTVVEGFNGTEEACEKLGKELKSHCGCGGSVDEGIILIQGDQRKKVMEFLRNKGFKTNQAI